MFKSYYMRLFTLLLLLSLITSLNAASHRDFAQAGVEFSLISTIVDNNLFVAEVDVNAQGDADQSSGPLGIPEDDNNIEKSERKCMKVCDKWGEDCIINPRTGSRKCRKICKNFGEECF
jgi:hypothetical protein